MFSFLHNYLPNPVLASVGPLTLHWYGLMVSLAIAIGMLAVMHIGKKSGIKAETVMDISITAIIGGLIGARLYEVLLIEPVYYFQDPIRILKIWEGGLAIHGGLIGGAFAIWLYCRYIHMPFIKAAATLVTGLAAGQAIGRIGNWFNQELYGQPSFLPWSIPISADNRVLGYEGFSHFHPTFLYESLGCILIALVLWLLARSYRYSLERHHGWKMVLAYLGLYSLLRFLLEFIKIDPTLTIAGIRWPQALSLIVSLSATAAFILIDHNKKTSKPMKALFSRKDNRRNLILLYILGAVLAVANALPAYIQSNYLGSLLSITWISIFFLVANLATVIAIVYYPRIISRTGNSASTEAVLLLFILSLLGLSLARDIWTILLAFIALSIATNLIWINMDILVEKFSEDASTGTTRTMYFTAINLGWIIAPTLSSFLVERGDYYWVFLAAAIFLVPFFALLISYRKRFKDTKKYRTDSTRKTIRSFMVDPDLRGAYVLSLLLNIFYSSAVVYIPIYLHQQLGFAWPTLGLMFSIMLVPFILFEIPAGYIADKLLGEKELLGTGLTIVIISLFIFFTYRIPDAFWWGALLFMSRIGAALIEAMRESYFFKKVGASDIPLINFFRTTAPLGYLIGTGMAALVFLFYPLQYLFIFVALAMASGYIFLHKMADSR